MTGRPPSSTPTCWVHAFDRLAAWPLVTVDYAAIRAAAGLASQAKFRTPDIPPSNPWKLHVFEAMGADQNLSAFSDRQNANRRRNRAVLLAATHSAAESRTEVSAPSPAHGCGPKPVRFFGSAEC